MMGLRVRYSCRPRASDLTLPLNPRPAAFGWPIHGRHRCLLARACIIPPKAPTARPDLFGPVAAGPCTVWMGPPDLSVYIPVDCTPGTQEYLSCPWQPGVPMHLHQGLTNSSAVGRVGTREGRWIGGNQEMDALWRQEMCMVGLIWTFSPGGGRGERRIGFSGRTGRAGQDSLSINFPRVFFFFFAFSDPPLPLPSQL
ncbi:hypothetical protein BO70DRAFT_416747 [Aspergillus heteromorphus CBS 117.55]|uniref:Uncharacterized protein n=1 Tax=Aspergillus heteromorphus CBS 117.55 TaxID=1448321 RepID=A0A317V823_9EURO|nr:uncharacterized protein BO70DRAFT_416747 [Aspergillus heteromorphus CBS 117.55]PWY69529.1 hypothetical protein BO70DRAFT_416747 [Aspergillus heteromorphus CBS 117.55]